MSTGGWCSTIRSATVRISAATWSTAGSTVPRRQPRGGTPGRVAGWKAGGLRPLRAPAGSGPRLRRSQARPAPRRSGPFPGPPRLRRAPGVTGFTAAASPRERSLRQPQGMAATAAAGMPKRIARGARAAGETCRNPTARSLPRQAVRSRELPAADSLHRGRPLPGRHRQPIAAVANRGSSAEQSRAAARKCTLKKGTQA